MDCGALLFWQSSVNTWYCTSTARGKFHCCTRAHYSFLGRGREQYYAVCVFKCKLYIKVNCTHTHTHIYTHAHRGFLQTCCAAEFSQNSAVLSTYKYYICQTVIWFLKFQLLLWREFWINTEESWYSCTYLKEYGHCCSGNFAWCSQKEWDCHFK